MVFGSDRAARTIRPADRFYAEKALAAAKALSPNALFEIAPAAASRREAGRRQGPNRQNQYEFWSRCIQSGCVDFRTLIVQLSG